MKSVVGTLRRGGIVCMATDTVYGLHCSAGNAEWVSRLCRLKGSGPRPFILLAPDPGRVEEMTAGVTRTARRLMEEYWPGALTLVFRAGNATPDWLLGPGSTIAVRCPEDPLCRQVLKSLGSPLVSTSANSKGGKPCLTGAEAAAQFLDEVDVVVDSGPAPSELPSTIVDVTAFPHKVLRQGRVTIDRGLLGTEA